MSKIINFSEAASIGIHSAILIARSDVPLNAVELSKKLGSSKYNIGKVLQRLVKDGILSSLRGPAGGFSLKKKPEDVLIYDIYRSIEGEVDSVNCNIDVHICPLDKCIRETIIIKLTEEFVNYLKAYTLKDYL